MKHQTLVLSLAAALAAGALTPAAAADNETRQMMADIRMLQQQSQQLQNVLGTLGEALKALNTRLDEQTDVNRKAFADQKVIIETLSHDLRVVRERADDTNVRLGSLSQEVDALHDAVQALNVPAPPPAPTTTDGTLPDPLNPDAPPAAAAAPPPTPAPMPVGSPSKVWNSAHSDYTAGLYDLAIIGFEAYIKSFPTSDQADNAQVYIATAYLIDGKNKEAIEAADLAIRTYPTGDAIPEAYYRKGTALRNLKEHDRARQAFEQVYKNYPNSPEAVLALQQIQQLMKP
jgi:TolA-binding protein